MQTALPAVHGADASLPYRVHVWVRSFSGKEHCHAIEVDVWKQMFCGENCAKKVRVNLIICEKLDSEKGRFSCPHVLLYFELLKDCSIEKVQCLRQLDVIKELKMVCGLIFLHKVKKAIFWVC